MNAADVATTTPWTALVRREAAGFRRRGRVIAMAAATLAVILLGLLFTLGLGVGSSCSAGPVEIACPTDPIGPHGEPVADEFFFAHRPMGDNGTITVRLTAMAGVITYPPPDHDE